MGAAVGKPVKYPLRRVYNSQNETVAHFGLGDAAIIDSLVIQWPSGIRDTFLNLAGDGEIIVIEGGGVTGLRDFSEQLPGKFALHPNFPNPFNPETIIRYEIPSAAEIEIIIFQYCRTNGQNPCSVG